MICAVARTGTRRNRNHRETCNSVPAVKAAGRGYRTPASDQRAISQGDSWTPMVTCGQANRQVRARASGDRSASKLIRNRTRLGLLGPDRPAPGPLGLLVAQHVQADGRSGRAGLDLGQVADLPDDPQAHMGAEPFGEARPGSGQRVGDVPGVADLADDLSRC